MLKHLKGRFFGLAEIFADSGKKGMGLCIFCRKNSFQGLEAINLGLIPKYWILHFWVKYLGFCGGEI